MQGHSGTDQHWGAHPEAAAWNIAFDARGHLIEPHTGQIVPLGTLEIREHLDEVGSLTIGDVEAKVTEKSFPTCGPRHRYTAILFIEKEGFFPLFNQAQLAERYDIAIMSTKGITFTTTRRRVRWRQAWPVTFLFTTTSVCTRR